MCTVVYQQKHTWSTASSYGLPEKGTLSPVCTHLWVHYFRLLNQLHSTPSLVISVHYCMHAEVSCGARLLIVSN